MRNIFKRIIIIRKSFKEANSKNRYIQMGAKEVRNVNFNVNFFSNYLESSFFLFNFKQIMLIK